MLDPSHFADDQAQARGDYDTADTCRACHNGPITEEGRCLYCDAAQCVHCGIWSTGVRAAVQSPYPGVTSTNLSCAVCSGGFVADAAFRALGMTYDAGWQDAPLPCWDCGRLPTAYREFGTDVVYCDNCQDGDCVGDPPALVTTGPQASGRSRAEAVDAWNLQAEEERCDLCGRRRHQPWCPGARS